MDIRIALKKCQHVCARQWGGYLTPTEAVVLVERGAKARPEDARRMRTKIAQGDSGPNWFYFEVSGDFEKLIKNNRPSK